MRTSRRDFVRQVAAASSAITLGAAFGRRAQAYPLGLKPGVQLWSVKTELEADPAGTLRKLGAMGYREVELYELPKKPAEFKQQCADAGVAIVGGHFYLQSFADRKTIDTARDLGMQYMIVVFPTLRAIAERDISNLSVQELMPMYEKISADDYRWNAEQFNRYGATLKKDGLQLGYHNHAVDLKKFGPRTGYEILIESTDPELVVFEMDCGHMIHSGSDPLAYLKKYANRIALLHLKDLVKGFHVSTTIATEEMDTNAELGKGVIDWKALFRAASTTNVKHYFVEHEGKMAHDPLASVANSLAYLKTL